MLKTPVGSLQAYFVMSDSYGGVYGPCILLSYRIALVVNPCSVNFLIISSVK